MVLSALPNRTKESEKDKCDLLPVLAEHWNSTGQIRGDYSENEQQIITRKSGRVYQGIAYLHHPVNHHDPLLQDQTAVVRRVAVLLGVVVDRRVSPLPASKPPIALLVLLVLKPHQLHQIQRLNFFYFNI